jgi:hypothetical protein
LPEGDAFAVHEAASSDRDPRRGGHSEADERHLLEPAPVRTGGPQAKPLEAGGDVAGGDVVAARAGFAAFEKVVGEEGDMGAEALRGEIGRRRLLRDRGDRERQREAGGGESETLDLHRLFGLGRGLGRARL